MIILGLDISKLTATYWLLSEVPEDPKTFSRTRREEKITVSAKGRDALLALEFDFAVIEPTGIYSRIWRQWLNDAGKAYRLVGHQELASYRNGWKLNKTDKLDSLAMAMYGLERASRPSCWLVERDRTLSDLVLLHRHLNRQKNGSQNNLRQRLTYQCPELYNKDIKREWGCERIPGILNAIAGNPSKSWKEKTVDTIGSSFSLDSQALARILISIEQEEIRVEQAIEAELSKECYQPYRIAATNCNFTDSISACLISAIYPFEQFLDEQGKRRISHILSKEKGKRCRKDSSLRSFKMACGMGLTWIQSGDFEGWVAGGNGIVRERLHNSVTGSYLSHRKAIKRGEKGNANLAPMKNYYDAQGAMKVCRKMVEGFYSELVTLFAA